MMKILCLIPNIDMPRGLKRIKNFKELGIQYEIFGFEREYFKGKIKSNEYTSLGHIEHQKYVKRIPAIIKALPIINKASRGCDVVYAFGVDCLLLGCLASCRKQKRKLVYEVADIQSMMLGTGLKSRLLRWLERFLLRRLD